MKKLLIALILLTSSCATTKRMDDLKGVSFIQRKSDKKLMYLWFREVDSTWIIVDEVMKDEIEFHNKYNVILKFK